MNDTTLTIAERIACAICWLARQNGLPDIQDLRIEVSVRHPLACDWCDYPLPELLRMSSLDGAPGIGEFGRLPGLAQRRLVLKALHGEVAA